MPTKTQKPRKRTPDPKARPEARPSRATVWAPPSQGRRSNTRHRKADPQAGWGHRDTSDQETGRTGQRGSRERAARHERRTSREVRESKQACFLVRETEYRFPISGKAKGYRTTEPRSHLWIGEGGSPVHARPALQGGVKVEHIPSRRGKAG